jgi:succinate-semialdehyde dehydrogenase/glutarate-semialdehyde dehydrogenase
MPATSHPADATLLRQAALVDGRWIEAQGRESRCIRNPADQSIVGVTPMLLADDIDDAVAAASRAFIGWSRTTARERAGILRRLAELMRERIADLATIMTLEQGKPLAEARGEIEYAAGFVEWFAEECKRLYSEAAPSPWPDKRLMVLRQPMGVVAAITPWNFPSAMVTRKAIPALAAGCAVILKPAEQTPFSALALGVLAQRAGLPPGVLNIVTGDAPMIGKTLCASREVRKVTFTGSPEVGRILMAQCAPTIKKLALELGGNAPFIVLNDADIDAAVIGAMASKYRNAGQTCICANRFLVQSDVYSEFVEKLADASGKLRVSHGFDPKAQQGPLIDEPAIEKVERLVGDAVAGGARVVVGGQRAVPNALFYNPTVLADVTPTMLIAREEIFGPVAPVIRFADDDECIRVANSSEYGLAAYFYGQNLGRVWRMMEALEFGIVGINSGVVSTEVAPFGGVKQSGIGREGGREGLQEFTELKYVCIGGI